MTHLEQLIRSMVPDAKDHAYMQDAICNILKVEEYIRKHIPAGLKFNVAQMPCSSPDEFFALITILNMAGAPIADKEFCVIDDESDNSAINNSVGYVLPSVVIKRCNE